MVDTRNKQSKDADNRRAKAAVRKDDYQSSREYNPYVDLFDDPAVFEDCFGIELAEFYKILELCEERLAPKGDNLKNASATLKILRLGVARPL